MTRWKWVYSISYLTQTMCF